MYHEIRPLASAHDKPPILSVLCCCFMCMCAVVLCNRIVLLCCVHVRVYIVHTMKFARLPTRTIITYAIEFMHARYTSKAPMSLGAVAQRKPTLK